MFRQVKPYFIFPNNGVEAFAVQTFYKLTIDHVILCLCYVLANIKVIFNILKLFQNYCIFNYIRYIFSIYNKTKYLSE